MLTETKRFLISTYNCSLNNDFYVDIIGDSITGTFNAWLYHESYGIKEFMFGSYDCFDDFLELVNSNLDNYISYYLENYTNEPI